MQPTKKPRHRFFRGQVLPKLLLTFWPLPRNTFCSIDVTARCNLRCRHCYFFSGGGPEGQELSCDEWLARIEAMQRSRGAFFSCTWVGGEPLLRREIIERGRRFFRANRVVTNGTLPLPDWPDVEFHVSVDGTRERHDAIRGEGCYDRIKKNLSDPRSLRLKIAIACCLNRINLGSAAELVREWRGHPHVRHILFDFMTPICGADDGIALSLPERDEAIATLKSLKERHGDFIGGPPGTFDLMLARNRLRAVGKNCAFVRNGVAFDASGSVKRPCVMGPGADCDRCGCIVPFSLRAWKRPTNLLREALRDLIR